MRYFALRGANGERWLVLPVLLVLSLPTLAHSLPPLNLNPL